MTMQNEEFQTPQDSSSTEGINIRHYWHVVLERRWLIVTAFFSVVALSLIYLAKATPIYQAVSRLQINRESEGMVFQQTAVTTLDKRDPEYMVTMQQNLVLDKVNPDKQHVYMQDNLRVFSQLHYPIIFQLIALKPELLLSPAV